MMPSKPKLGWKHLNINWIWNVLGKETLCVTIYSGVSLIPGTYNGASVICRTGSHFQLSCHKTNGEFSIYPFVIRSASHQNQKLLTFFFVRLCPLSGKPRVLMLKVSIFSVNLMTFQSFYLIFFFVFLLLHLRGIICTEPWSYALSGLLIKIPSGSRCHHSQLVFMASF